MADFLAAHPSINVLPEIEDKNLLQVNLVPWKLYFDGSSTSNSAGVWILLLSPEGIPTRLSFVLDEECTNYRAEYKALIVG